MYLLGNNAAIYPESLKICFDKDGSDPNDRGTHFNSSPV
jgi:hypothetical protein